MKMYRPAITLWKALWVYLASVGIIGAGEVAAVGLPETWGEFAAEWPRYVIALAPAVWRAVENARKNWLSYAPLWEWPWSRWEPTS